MQLVYFVSGMWCATCARTVQHKVRRIPGVAEAELNYASKLLLVRLAAGAEPETVDGAIRRKIEDAGFSVKRQSEGWIQNFRRELERERERAIPPVLVAVTVFLAMWSSMLAFAGYLGGLDGLAERQLSLWSACFGVPALLLGMVPFAKAGGRALLKSRLVTLDLFVAFGAASAAFLSLANLWMGRAESYADSGAMVLVVLLSAKTLEARLSGHLSEKILSHVQPSRETVELMGATGWTVADVSQVRRGDRVRFSSGETIALDGRLLEASAMVNAYLLNGEGDDLVVQAGEPIRSGCIARSPVTLEVTGGLGFRMIDRWAESAMLASGRPHVFSSLLQRLERGLVMGSLLGASALGVLSYWSSGALQPAVEAFLVGVLIFCPCLFASILPMARQMAHLALAGVGVSVTRSECLFDLSRLERVYLDKTGTLESVETAFCAARREGSHPRVIPLLAELCERSSHPLLRGLRSSLGAASAIEGARVEEHPGLGAVLTTLDGETLRVGRATFAAPGEDLQEDCPLVVYNGALQGTIVSRSYFDRQGLAFLSELLRVLPERTEIEILSGDPRPEAGRRFVALAPGRIRYRGGCTPQEKADLVQGRSLFVGDGLNDTLALAKASVSCRIGNRALGFAPADLQVEGHRLLSLIAVLDYSGRFVRVLAQTAGLAFTYNLAAWTLAAAGRFSPLGAVLAMTGSFLLLVLSASRTLAPPKSPPAAGQDRSGPTRM